MSSAPPSALPAAPSAGANESSQRIATSRRLDTGRATPSHARPAGQRGGQWPSALERKRRGAWLHVFAEFDTSIKRHGQYDETSLEHQLQQPGRQWSACDLQAVNVVRMRTLLLRVCSTTAEKSTRLPNVTIPLLMHALEGSLNALLSQGSGSGESVSASVCHCRPMRPWHACCTTRYSSHCCDVAETNLAKNPLSSWDPWQMGNKWQQYVFVAGANSTEHLCSLYVSVNCCACSQVCAPLP